LDRRWYSQIEAYKQFPNHMSSANQRHLSDSAQRKVNSTYTDAAHQNNEE